MGALGDKYNSDNESQEEKYRRIVRQEIRKEKQKNDDDNFSMKSAWAGD